MSVKPYLLSLSAVLCGSLAVAAQEAPAPTGQFGLPYNANQSWSTTAPSCGRIGWIPYGDPDSHQYHMQFYSVVGKYHMGEDWNGKCGGNTDQGAPLLAIADGRVVFVDDSPNGMVQGQGKRLYIRHSFPYALTPGGVMTFDSVMLHLQRMGSRITGRGIGVTKGETIAYLGKTGTRDAHLHWEAQTDLNIPLGTNPYQNPLPKAYALGYRAPSLIVDDRRDIRSYPVAPGGRWFTFTMQGNAPSSTLYVSRNGQHKSLKNAIAAGWIPAQSYPFEADHNFFKMAGSTPSRRLFRVFPSTFRCRATASNKIEPDSI